GGGPPPADPRARRCRPRLRGGGPRRGGGDARGGLLEAGLPVVAIAHGLVELLPARRARLDEVPRARELQLRQLHGRLRGALLGPRLALVGERQPALGFHLLERRALLVRAKLDQHLPLLDALPILHGEL